MGDIHDARQMCLKVPDNKGFLNDPQWNKFVFYPNLISHHFVSMPSLTKLHLTSGLSNHHKY